jgi:hypothetical protein
MAALVAAAGPSEVVREEGERKKKRGEKNYPLACEAHMSTGPLSVSVQLSMPRG